MNIDPTTLATAINCVHEAMLVAARRAEEHTLNDNPHGASVWEGIRQERQAAFEVLIRQCPVSDGYHRSGPYFAEAEVEAEVEPVRDPFAPKEPVKDLMAALEASLRIQRS